MLHSMPKCSTARLQRRDSSAALPRRFISNCDLVQGVPPALRSQAARIIGGKTALLARIDAANGDPTGEGRLHNTQRHMFLPRFPGPVTCTLQLCCRDEHFSRSCHRMCTVQHPLHGAAR
jgi:snoRNA binding domain, fibrillarin